MLMMVGRVLDVKLQKMGRDCVHGQVMVDEQLHPCMDGCNGVQGWCVVQQYRGNGKEGLPCTISDQQMSQS